MSKLARWSLRTAWLAAVVIGYRSLVDVGPQGSGSYGLHMIAMFAIFVAGDGLLEASTARSPGRETGG